MHDRAIIGEARQNKAPKDTRPLFSRVDTITNISREILSRSIDLDCAIFGQPDSPPSAFEALSNVTAEDNIEAHLIQIERLLSYIMATVDNTLSKVR